MSRPGLGVWSGAGLVVATTIGAGVFLSTGFMAQEMGPGPIMAAWVVGAGLALCGAVSYGAVASVLARSGGEYRYLSDLLHPALGYLAGWASLFLGFAAPVAVGGLAAGAFVNTLVPGPDPRVTAAALVLLLTLVHALRLGWSRWAQDLLALLKLVLVLGFVLVGLSLGSHAWPAWSPPAGGDGFPWRAFISNQYWIAFAFGGWNAAVYAAGEFRDPRRSVPRATIIGCAVVACVYLLVNWIFVANLGPQEAAAVFEYEATSITLGHLVTTSLLGPAGGRAMSLLAILSFVSAMSAMTMVGPRVYAAMAEDGYLPRWLAARGGRPPTGSVLLQGSVAILFISTHTLLEAMQGASAVVLLFSGLVAFSLFRAHRLTPGSARSPRRVLAAAAVYVVGVVVILLEGARQSPHLVGWAAALALLSFGAWSLSRRRLMSG